MTLNAPTQVWGPFHATLMSFRDSAGRVGAGVDLFDDGTMPCAPGCLLRTDPALLFLVPTSASGLAALPLDGSSIPFPRLLVLFAQAANVDLAAGTVRTSQALRIVCQ